MTIEIDALSIFDASDVFSLVFDSRNKHLEDGTILKSLVADVKVKLNVFSQKENVIVVGSIGQSTLLLAEMSDKWLMYMNEDSNTLPPSANRKQHMNYFSTVLRNDNTQMLVCKRDDWEGFATNICQFIKDAR